MRILIATITAGGGHIQAAAALDEVRFRRTERPRDVIEKVDLQEHFSHRCIGKFIPMDMSN